MSPPFDAAIVLGAKVHSDGSPSAALVRRVRHGVRLLGEGRVGALVMSGGPVSHMVPEAHVMRDLAVSLGAPAEAVLVEDGSFNTIGNARLCGPLVRARGWRRLVVVTDASHLPRALYVFRRFGIRAKGSAAPPSRPPGREWYAAWAREALALPWTVMRVEWGRRPSARRRVPGEGK